MRQEDIAQGSQMSFHAKKDHKVLIEMFYALQHRQLLIYANLGQLKRIVVFDDAILYDIFHETNTEHNSSVNVRVN